MTTPDRAPPRPADEIASNGRKHVAIIGAGPAGLFAAERVASAGHRVTVFDRMPSPARKFLMAGRGGLNLTHSEPLAAFLDHYPGGCQIIRDAVTAFPPDALIAWANGLGVETFIGSSGRIFPKSMKASPLLRAWLQRLRSLGVEFRFRHRWTGFAADHVLRIENENGIEQHIDADAILFALGGASWPRLGSDGAWQSRFSALGLTVAPLVASNCGIDIPWCPYFRERFAGAPLKRIAISNRNTTRRGEAMVTRHGLEGGAVYAIGSEIRKSLDANGTTIITIDLKPDTSTAQLAEKLERGGRTQSMSNLLRKAAALSPVAANLVRETGPLPNDRTLLAERIKSVTLPVTGLANLDRAISSAGGIELRNLTPAFESKSHPGVFFAGEMLDWEAPTGGYLLQATFASANRAADGILANLASNKTITQDTTSETTCPSQTET